jgi:hypothetical protein
MRSYSLSGANNSHPLKGPHARQIQNYARHALGLKSDIQQPGDGRAHPHIPVADVVWALVMSRFLRVTSFFRLEWLVHPAAPSAWIRRRRAWL